MDPPELHDAVHEFSVTLANHALLDDESAAWLQAQDTSALSGRQRLALAYLRRRGWLTNRLYRTVNGCDALTATRELGGLYSLGWLVKRGDRRGTTWILVAKDAAPKVEREPDLFDTPAPDRKRMDRRDQIRALLQPGPLSAIEITEHIGITRRSTLSWLVRMETDGIVERTEPLRTSRRNRWRLRRSTSSPG